MSTTQLVKQGDKKEVHLEDKTEVLEKRLTVIQLNWPLGGYTKDLINALNKNGCQVNLITNSRSLSKYVDVSDIQADIIIIPGDSGYSFLWKAWRMLSIFLPSLRPVDPILNARLTNIANIVNKHVICVELESLLSLHSAMPGYKNNNVYYWSLELYTNGHPSAFKYKPLYTHASNIFNKLKGIIIQDEQRLEEIRRNIDSISNPFFFPISASGKPITEKSTCIQDRLSLPHGIKCILVHGNISYNRGLKKILDMALITGPKYHFILQGNILDKVVDKIPSNVSIINEVFDESYLLDFIASADIGLAIYTYETKNDSLISCSSYKLALYSRCGLPFIAFKNESFEKMLLKVKWGELLSSVGDISRAIDLIMRDYTTYHCNAHVAFDNIYSVETHVKKITEYLFYE